MSRNNLNVILKQVSRSFYLSIRILPKPMQDPVSIAYLLARAADSIADCNKIVHEARVDYLLSFSDIIEEASFAKAKALSKKVGPTLIDPDERNLIFLLPTIIKNFASLEISDRSRVQAVVTTLIKGMKMDLAVFNDEKTIIALKNKQQLEEYTYLVAGCVGEFWTKTAIAHLSILNDWDADIQINYGVKFGKALQLTNILRDVAKDVRLGRCYLPEEDLKYIHLSKSLLLEKKNHHLFRPIVIAHLKMALSYFESAESYLLATPRSAIRLRLASLWPILIGLKTLQLIAEKENFLDIDKNIKVRRQWVYSMLIRTLFIIGSNRLTKYWIGKLRIKIQHQIFMENG